MGHYKNLEIEQDLTASRKLWRRQTIGRIAWGIIGLLALAGLFGSGPLSETIAQDSDDVIEVEYQRFAHLRSNDILELKLKKAAAIGGKIHIWIDSQFLKDNHVKRISPEPTTSRLDNNRSVFEFDIGDDFNMGKIVLETESSKAGVNPVALGLVGGPEISFWKFVWP